MNLNDYEKLLPEPVGANQVIEPQYTKQNYNECSRLFRSVLSNKLG